MRTLCIIMEFVWLAASCVALFVGAPLASCMALLLAIYTRLISWDFDYEN